MPANARSALAKVPAVRAAVHKLRFQRGAIEMIDFGSGTQTNASTFVEGHHDELAKLTHADLAAGPRAAVDA
jgi:hypothetical protein